MTTWAIQVLSSCEGFVGNGRVLRMRPWGAAGRPRITTWVRNLTSNGDGRVDSGRVLGVRRARIWNEMPADVQALWRTLGWTPASWSGLTDPPSAADKYWVELSPREKEAALALGYTSPQKWDEDPEDPFDYVDGNPYFRTSSMTTGRPALVQAMKDMTWEEMPASQQRHWTTLGWNSMMWNEYPDCRRPASASKFFSHLSANEQAAALALGYTEESWNDDDDAGSGAGDATPGGSWAKDADLTTLLKAAGGLALLAAALSAEAHAQRIAADASTAASTTHLSRQAETRRSGWLSRVAQSGLTFADLPGICWGHWLVSEILLPQVWIRRLGLDDPYWNEAASYKLSDEGAWRIESAAFELHSMLLEATDEVVRSDVLLAEFGIPEELWTSVRRSWRSRNTDFIGRFDLLWDGEGEPKLAEYNADTPTVLIEAGAAQRNWCRDVHPDKGQFNVLDEALEAAWRSIAEDLIARHSDLSPEQLTLAIAAQGVRDRTVIDANGSMASGWFGGPAPEFRHWGGLGFKEEEATAVYMASRAARGVASMSASRAPTVQLRSVDALKHSDLRESRKNPHALWKLYPWEWIVREAIGLPFVQLDETTRAQLPAPSSWARELSTHLGPPSPPLEQLYEPPWKLVMSSKAMLAYLWAKYPGHKNLLPAAMADDLSTLGDASYLSTYRAKDWVSKPVLGREGHGLLYGDEWKARKDVPAHALTSTDDGPSLKAFASMVAETQEAVSIVPRVEAPPEMPTSDEGVAIVKRAIMQQATDVTTGVSQLLDRGELTKQSGELDDTVLVHTGPSVIQKFYELPELSGRKVVTSCWVVRGMPVAACFREDTLRTTNNNSCFVPHYVDPSVGRLEDGSLPDCCPHRDFALSPNQYRLRAELYGLGGLASADLAVASGKEHTGEDGRPQHDHRHYASRCYSSGGYAGRGYSQTGSGGRGAHHGSSSSGGGHASKSGGHGSNAAASGVKPLSHKQGEAAATANAAKAEKARQASGVAKKREAVNLKAKQRQTQRNMVVHPMKRTPGSMGTHPGSRYSPPGSTGHSTQGGYSG